MQIAHAGSNTGQALVGGFGQLIRHPGRTAVAGLATLMFGGAQAMSVAAYLNHNGWGSGIAIIGVFLFCLLTALVAVQALPKDCQNRWLLVFTAWLALTLVVTPLLSIAMLDAGLISPTRAWFWFATSIIGAATGGLCGLLVGRVSLGGRVVLGGLAGGAMNCTLPFAFGLDGVHLGFTQLVTAALLWCGLVGGLVVGTHNWIYDRTPRRPGMDTGHAFAHAVVGKPEGRP